MSFMSLEETGLIWWVEVDGPNGTDVIPCDVCGRLPDYDETVADCPEGVDPDDYYREAAFAEVADYCENSECYSISEREGYGARASAPGYMDCTEWVVCDTAAEAKRIVCDEQELCPACGESTCDDYVAGGNPACRIYHANR